MNTKVLVVDDEFLIRMSLESGLSDLGHQVKTAETFSEGLALAESWRPDVVLLDNKLGGELGLEHIEEQGGNTCFYLHGLRARGKGCQKNG